MSTAIAGATKTKSGKAAKSDGQVVTATSLKVDCSREGLMKAFAIAAGVAPARSPKEILNNVRMTVSEEGVRLQATDMEMSIAMFASDCDVVRHGDALLPTQRVLAILRESSDDSVVIEVSGTEVVLSTQVSTFRLPSANPAEYPAKVNRVEDADHFVVPATMLIEALKCTMFATDVDSSRYALGGMKVELIDDGTVNIVGTDGRRLAAVSGQGVSVGGHCSAANGSTIIPVKAAGVILRAFSAEGEPIKVRATANELIFEQGNVVLNTRLVEGTYPNWRQVIPQRDVWTFQQELTAGSFGALVNLASITTDADTRGLIFLLRKGEIVAQGGGKGLGDSNVSMPTSHDGEPIEIRLDHRYLKDFIRVLDPAGSFTMKVSAGTESVLLTSGGYSYVVMPMSLEQ